MNNLLKFNMPDTGIIQDASSRVKMLLGLYNMGNDKTLDFTCSASPQLTLGNILYLRSYQSNSLATYKNDNDFLTPICYKINTFLNPGLPIIINKKQDVINTYYDAIAKIKIELLDRNFEPVVLKSPLKIDIKIVGAP